MVRSNKEVFKSQARILHISLLVCLIVLSYSTSSPGRVFSSPPEPDRAPAVAASKVTTTTSIGVTQISVVGILYDQPRFAEVVIGANWIGVVLSDPLDETIFKPFVDKMHSAGLTVAGTICRPTIDAVSAATLKASSFGFDMIIFDELLSLGVLGGNDFNRISKQVKTKFPKVKIGMSDYDIPKLTDFMRVAKPDFIAVTAYSDAATSKRKIDAIASLGARGGIPAYAWVNFADPAAPSTLDQALLTELAKYAKSKLNGVWFWEYGDASWSGWEYGNWYVTNYPYVRTLTTTIRSN